MTKFKKKYIFIVALFSLFFLIPQVRGAELSVIIDHSIEDIDFQTEYSVVSDFEDWKITDNKAIRMKVHILDNPSNKTIFIEHMHCDAIIESTHPGFDGMTQDSMDDKIHMGDQPGFYISEKYSYEEVFSIEGASPTFVQFWGYVYGGFFYSGESKSYKYSEEALTGRCEVYGMTFYMVFDVLIKEENEDFYHKSIIEDNIFINLEGQIDDNVNDTHDLPAEDEIPGFMISIIVGTIIGTVALIYIPMRKYRA